MILVVLHLYLLAAQATNSRLVSFITLVFTFGLIALFVGNALSFIVGASGSQESESAGFRSELYHQLPNILTMNPWGSGLGAIPDHLIVFSGTFGTISAAHTVDSEYVFAAIRFGIVGLAFWVAAITTITREWSRHESPAASAFIILVAFGSIVALDAWVTILCLLALLFGILHSEAQHSDSGARALPATQISASHDRNRG